MAAQSSKDDKTAEANARNRTTPRTAEEPDPSLERLGDELIQGFRRLEVDESSEEAPQHLRVTLALLEQIHVLTWREVFSGNPGAPRKMLRHFRGLQPFADKHLPKEEPPALRAAQALRATLDGLHVADEALEEARTQERLANTERSPREREVLAVLASSDGPLRRGQVHERLNPKTRPTPARIGQVLAELHSDGLLRRIPGPAQGNAQTSFYELTNLGRQLTPLAELPHPIIDGTLSGQEAARKILAQTAATLFDPYVPRNWRSVAAGIFSEVPEELESDLAQELSYWANHYPADDSEATRFLTNLKETILLRIKTVTGESPRQKQELLHEILSVLTRLLKPSPAVSTKSRESEREETTKAETSLEQ